MKRYAIGLALATMLSAFAPAYSQVFYTDYGYGGYPYYGSYYDGWGAPSYVDYSPYSYGGYYGYNPYNWSGYGYGYDGWGSRYRNNNSWQGVVRDIVRSVLY
jgi:hypothetical protein